jgi:hypothetical protein
MEASGECLECEKRGVSVLVIAERYFGDGSPGQSEAATICEKCVSTCTHHAAEVLEHELRAMFRRREKQATTNVHRIHFPVADFCNFSALTDSLNCEHEIHGSETLADGQDVGATPPQAYQSRVRGTLQAPRYPRAQLSIRILRAWRISITKYLCK